MMLSLFRLKDQIAIIMFAPFVSDRRTNFQCLRFSWSEISFFIAVINCGFYGCRFIPPYVNVSLPIIAVIRAVGWQIFLVQSTFECARSKFWIYLNAKIVAICHPTTVVIVANAQYTYKYPLWTPYHPTSGSTSTTLPNASLSDGTDFELWAPSFPGLTE